MYTYPSILGPQKAPHQPCIAFEKLDGSNLRWEYSRKKKSWCKAGTRQRLFDESEPILGQAIPLFHKKYADPLTDIIRKHPDTRNCDKVTVFCEFLGPSSFAGQHVEDEPKDLILFDVHLYKHGILGPREFLDIFGGLQIPKVVYEGVLNDSFIQDVKDGKYPVVEGVVCKGGKGHKLWMRKIKTLAYLQKLKDNLGKDWEKFAE